MVIQTIHGIHGIEQCLALRPQGLSGLVNATPPGPVAGQPLVPETPLPPTAVPFLVVVVLFFLFVVSFVLLRMGLRPPTPNFVFFVVPSVPQRGSRTFFIIVSRSNCCPICVFRLFIYSC